MDRLKPRTIRLIGRLHAWLWKRRSWVKALVSWALKRWEFRQVLALRLVRLGGVGASELLAHALSSDKGIALVKRLIQSPGNIFSAPKLSVLAAFVHGSSAVPSPIE
jgi:hypothetical protein